MIFQQKMRFLLFSTALVLCIGAGLGAQSPSIERPQAFIGRFRYTEMFNNSFLSALVTDGGSSLTISIGSNGRALIEHLREPFRWSMNGQTLTMENHLFNPPSEHANSKNSIYDIALPTLLGS
jgi:hypothetical protein